MPWRTATNDDTTFKPASELSKIYFEHSDVSLTKTLPSIAESASLPVTLGLCLPTC